MEIVWYGLSCFRMIERGMVSIVTDPYSPKLGLPPLKLRADVVTVSHDAPGHNYVKAVKGNRRILTGPGEYELGGVFITGLQMKRKQATEEEQRPNTLYVFHFNDVGIAHLGDLSYVPSHSQIENLGAVDIALVPVGGGEALTASQAAEVISLIEPSIVIPMHYRTADEKIQLSSADRFLKEMGITGVETEKSLKVKKSMLTEDMQVVVLAPKG
jgi:L-ascorbate metabolism protein UlaG (beta-lactamase superfamily)